MVRALYHWCERYRENTVADPQHIAAIILAMADRKASVPNEILRPENPKLTK